MTYFCKIDDKINEIIVDCENHRISLKMVKVRKKWQNIWKDRVIKIWKIWLERRLGLECWETFRQMETRWWLKIWNWHETEKKEENWWTWQFLLCSSFQTMWSIADFEAAFLSAKSRTIHAVMCYSTHFSLPFSFIQ